MARPLILVTNDDGVLAEGLQVLVDAVQDLGDVVVCAPDTERSGASQAITLHSHLRATHVRERWWAVNGTPVDCVYLAVNHLCDRRPDLVLSGINPGHNLGIDVFYSGTVGGAAEGFLRGSTAIALSVPVGQPAGIAVPVLRRLLDRVFAQPQRMLLNVNLPAVVPRDPGPLPLQPEDIRARAEHLPIAVTRLGKRTYRQHVEQRTDLRGRPYFWIGGPPEETPEQEGEDTWAVTQGLCSVTPLELDITAADLDPFRRILGDHGRVDAST
ncbi:MAG: 5'/3'-nucleotidase SurE [Nannocystaceae bacterium]